MVITDLSRKLQISPNTVKTWAKDFHIRVKIDDKNIKIYDYSIVKLLRDILKHLQPGEILEKEIFKDYIGLQIFFITSCVLAAAIGLYNNILLNVITASMASICSLIFFKEESYIITDKRVFIISKDLIKNKFKDISYAEIKNVRVLGNKEEGILFLNIRENNFINHNAYILGVKKPYEIKNIIDRHLAALKN